MNNKKGYKLKEEKFRKMEEYLKKKKNDVKPSPKKDK